MLNVDDDDDISPVKFNFVITSMQFIFYYIAFSTELFNNCRWKDSKRLEETFDGHS